MTPPHYTLPSNQHLLGPQIGSGTCGTVYRLTVPSLAAKIIPPGKVHPSVRCEVALHKSLTHPNIARLHLVTTAQPTAPTPTPAPPPNSLALIMAHAPLGDMFTEVSAAGSLPPRVLRRRLRDIVAALTYLHENRIAHLDVKLENVVISSNSTAQLIDFGCAQRLDRRASATIGGTLHYLPPEYISRPATPPSEAADAWSLGVLAYTALAGTYPFNAACEADVNDQATRHRIVNCEPHPLPPHAESIADIVRVVYGLLEKDPSKRMKVSQVDALLKSDNFRIPLRVRKTYCAHGRPKSPAAASDADFGCDCLPEQSVADAVGVVDEILNERCRAREEVGRFLQRGYHHGEDLKA